MKYCLQLFIFTILICTPWDAFAVREVVFRKTTMVYEKQSKDSNVLTVFEKGERAPISSKNYGKWKKIVVEIDGEQKVGWVLSEDVGNSRIIDREDPFNSEVYHLNKWGIGLLGAFNFMTQGKRVIETGTASPPDITVNSISGAELYFGLAADIPMNQTSVIRLEFLFRKSSRSGTGTFEGGSDAEIQLDQTYLALGAMSKLYLARESNFWYGAGLEAAKLTESNLVYSTNGADEFVHPEGIKFPIFVFLNVGFGLDIHITKRFFVLPEIKTGIIVNSSPLVFTFEVRAPVVYTF